MIKITFHYRYRKQLILGGILLIVLAVIITFFVYPKNKSKTKQTVLAKTNIKKDIKKESTSSDNVEESTEEYKVDIKGEVVNPGIYTVKKSSRVIDCIELAGGLTANANTTVINLSKKVTDEMVIIVYSNAEVASFKETKKLEEQVQDYCRKKDENSLNNDACISNKETTNTLISINTATQEELQKLPGIGEAKAKVIITYRSEHGPFKSIEDLKQVQGIGEALFAQIKDLITI